MNKTILAHVKQYKLTSVLTSVFMALEVFMELLIPYVTAWIIDRGISQSDMGNVTKYGLMMLGMAMLSLLFGSLSAVCGATAATGLAKNLREAMFQNIQTFSFSNIDKFSSAGLITRMTTDVTNVQNAYMASLRIAVRTPLQFTISIIMCFVINRNISLMFLCALLVLTVAMALVMGNITGLFKKVFKKYDALNASVQENISGIRVVKAFVREDFENSKFVKAANNVYKLFLKAEGIMAGMTPLMMLLIYAIIIMVCWFSAHYIVEGTMTTGNLTSLFSYIMTALMSLMMLAMVFVMIVMAGASGRRIEEVLKETPDITDPENPVREIPDGSITFDHVDFAYPFQLKKEEEDEDKKDGPPMRRKKKQEEVQEAPPVPVLHNINLDIHSGETIGLIGATGCGKSTLVNLISRLYDTTSGNVIVGGHNVKEYGVEELRDAVSVVLQKNELFSGTILDNLRWGKEDATEEECIAACKLACADDFIQQFPDGYQTGIEQGGTNVSGGQKQRLCIARALLKSPKILILDDSTSAVDTATDAGIRRAFREEIPDTTKIIISQRISSVQDADRIIVMDGGRINGFASHEELLETNEIYREIFETQQKGSGDFDMN